ncbi:hypothetical protein GCM10027258_81790 [Amycolatopsis stemonae]
MEWARAACVGPEVSVAAGKLDAGGRRAEPRRAAGGWKATPRGGFRGCRLSGGRGLRVRRVKPQGRREPEG